ncbi:hypothetical protein QDR37_11205 [Amnibacterium sp. CER49]|uniref:hypothetical protein n=1 Tax=Amnibacterium sp. CER49 TaxID=3039161 RepID=UPI00244D383F|nr:hypothetical protein [Amnibacterium sp. CER49]MDH2444512.1 hypothetical protein [Amnibacterium sp. CER49]
MTLLASLAGLAARPVAPLEPSVVEYRTASHSGPPPLVPRLVLVGSRVTPGRHPVVALTWRTEGGRLAARPVLLVLERHGRRRTLAFRTDAASWAGGTTTATLTVRGLRPGAYRAYLSLPYADRRSRRDPALALRAANSGTWDAKDGLNALHQTVLVT